MSQISKIALLIAGVILLRAEYANSDENSEDISAGSLLAMQAQPEPEEPGGSDVHDYAEMVNNVLYRAYQLVDDLEGLLQRQGLYEYLDEEYEELYEYADEMKDFDYEDLEDVRDAGGELYVLESKLEQFEHHALNALKLNRGIDMEESDVRYMMQVVYEQLENHKKFFSQVEQMMVVQQQQ